jgi:hypothetical protein
MPTTEIERPGETVRFVLDGLDSAGALMSRTTVEWYGLENAAANQMQFDIVAKLIEVVAGWDAIKNPQA